MSAQALRADPYAPPGVAVRGDSARRDPLELLGLGALILLAPAAVIYLSFNAGGYFPSAPGFVAIILAQALLARTLLAQRPFEGFSRTLAVALGALALYAAWELASALWSGATARALDGFDRTLLYVLALALFGSLRYTRERMAWLLRGLVLGMSAVCLIGLISRLQPHTWPTASTFFSSRLSYPLTYWNAEGMLAASALIMGFHLSADRGEHRLVRALAATLLPGLAATLLLTFSRGALGVAAVGVVAYCLLTRLSTLPSALLAAVPASAIAMHSAWDATELASFHPTSAAAVSQGRHVAGVVVLCMLGAGLLRALLTPVDRRIEGLRIVRTPPALKLRVGLGASVAVLALAVALVAGAGGKVHNEYDKFVHGSGHPSEAQTRERLTDPGNNGRVSLWDTALRIYKTDELHGTGAGTYQELYPRYRSEGLYVTDAHSLYLQSLAELGLVGLALILVVILTILTGLARRMRGQDRGLYAALLAAFGAWSVHQAFDWDWQMPAVTIGLLMLVGLALARPAAGRRGPRGLPASRTIVALGWLLLAVAPLLGSVSYARLQDSAQQLRRGDCTAAKHDALSSLSLSAKRPQAYAIIGVCDLEQGFAPAAVSAMATATSLEPGSWEEQYWLAVARAGAGLDPRGAIGRAVRLNPLDSQLRRAASDLSGNDPRRWEGVASALLHRALASGKFSITSI